jgi:hypothetical protein
LYVSSLAASPNSGWVSAVAPPSLFLGSDHVFGEPSVTTRLWSFTDTEPNSAATPSSTSSMSSSASQ